ncbi:hypothetical protein ULMS_04790 [Patiriisocius marinistellae]|uniref:SH3b domain-containing protein n=1 Tax=Patiriisocius marinistellae TaxID=2494560 RepID=A0A5J4FZ62_9FLAO|nr:SH3 domain-containing protein [Patiriisocius marinistellae]GEQ84971.1 hypothetical protein ULMS_04790 [Patiriisocius marinistellae]
MKNTTFTFALLALIILSACKNNKEQTAQISEENMEDIVEEANKKQNSDYLYVTATSGLSLREFDNLNSEKLAVMPYGTKLKLKLIEENETMNVGGIKGGMHQVEYNNKTGYAFNGYLSEFFPPEKNAKAEFYIDDLKATHPQATFTETVGGTASNPTNTETVLLPTKKWHEAFYIAQKLYDIPLAFSFPNPKGRDAQTVKNPKKPDYMFSSELNVEREANLLKTIKYTQAGEGYGSSVTITAEGDMMKIEWTAVAD